MCSPQTSQTLETKSVSLRGSCWSLVLSRFVLFHSESWFCFYFALERASARALKNRKKRIASRRKMRVRMRRTEAEKTRWTQRAHTLALSRARARANEFCFYFIVLFSFFVFIDRLSIKTATTTTENNNNVLGCMRVVGIETARETTACIEKAINSIFRIAACHVCATGLGRQTPATTSTRAIGFIEMRVICDAILRRIAL